MGATLREQLLPFATGTQKACLRKVRYISRTRAAEVIQRRAESGETEKLYSYHCNHCDGWHLTRMRPPQD